MNYNFKCNGCEERATISRAMSEGPPENLPCECGAFMFRDWKVDAPQLDTSACKDHDHIPPDKRVLDLTDRRGEQEKERAFQKHIHDRRALVAEAGHGKQYRMSHSVPADLYYGKIRETGDDKYWDDPKNLARHNSCKVD